MRKNIAATIDPDTPTTEIIRRVYQTAIEEGEAIIGSGRSECVLHRATGRNAEHHDWAIKVPQCAYPLPFNSIHMAAAALVRYWMAA